MIDLCSLYLFVCECDWEPAGGGGEQWPGISDTSCAVPDWAWLAWDQLPSLCHWPGRLTIEDPGQLSSLSWIISPNDASIRARTGPHRSQSQFWLHWANIPMVIAWHLLDRQCMCGHGHAFIELRLDTLCQQFLILRIFTDFICGNNMPVNWIFPK